MSANKRAAYSSDVCPLPYGDSSQRRCSRHGEPVANRGHAHSLLSPRALVTCPSGQQAERARGEMEELSGLEQIVINYSSSPKPIYETRRWKWEERHIGLAATRGRSTGVGLSLSLTVIAAPVIFPPTSRHLSLSSPSLFPPLFITLSLPFRPQHLLTLPLSLCPPPPPPPHPLSPFSLSVLSLPLSRQTTKSKRQLDL